jgi:hypothetical protein
LQRNIHARTGHVAGRHRLELDVGVCNLVSKHEGHLFLPQPLLPNVLAEPGCLSQQIAPMALLAMCVEWSIYWLRALDSPPLTLHKTLSIAMQAPLEQLARVNIACSGTQEQRIQETLSEAKIASAALQAAHRHNAAHDKAHTCLDSFLWPTSTVLHA